MTQLTTRRRPWLYLAILGGVPMLVLLSLCVLLPTHWFAAHSGDPYLAGLGYGASLHQANCDILIDGDSTAEVGLDPTVFEQQTHLKTCNIAEPDGVRALNGNTVLDQYLAQNAAPHILLFLFNAPNLNPTADPGDAGRFEGFTYRMRQPHAISFALTHPTLTAKWIRGGIVLLKHVLLPSASSAQSNREASHGRLHLYGERRSTCAVLRMPSPPDLAWLNTLRKQYGSARTTILIDVMPLADCDPRFPIIQQQLHGAVDNALTTLPVSDFLLLGPHMTDAGANKLSREIAAQIGAANTVP